MAVHILSLPGESSRAVLPTNVSESTVEIRHSRGPAFFREIRHKFLGAALQINARHFHASDLYVLGSMASAAGRKGATYSYDARECYPHVPSTVGRPWIRWYWQMTEHRFIRGASARFTVSESIANHMARAYDIPPPTLVLNVPPARPINTSSFLRDQLGLSAETNIVLHLGQLKKDRGCDILVKAMTRVRDAHLVFLGSGPEKEHLEQISRSSNTKDRVHFIPPVSPDLVLDVASAATIGTTLLQDTCLNHRYALPNKLFEYVAAGLPILASDLTELKKVITSYGLGQVVDGSDFRAAGDALDFMLSDQQQLETWKHNTKIARETFHWEKASQPFLAELQSLMAS